MWRKTFRMAEVFPADHPIALWVLNLSIALGHLRIVSEYATRAEQPDAERMYFFRVFASHLREVARLLVDDYKAREEVRAFVATLPPEGQSARAEVDRMLHSHPYVHRPELPLWRDIKRVRDDTFHYVRDSASQERLRAVVEAVSDEQGVYVYDESKGLRADYADLVAGNRMQPYDKDQWRAATEEMLAAFVALNTQVVRFIVHVEAAHINSLPAGVVLTDPSRADG